MIKKTFILYLVILLLFACNATADQEKPNLASQQKTEKATTKKETPDSEINQDSLRSVILVSKENAYLKESMMQEFYVRDVVEVVDRHFVFNLSFDLHGLDCAAPDCYQTNLNFKIKEEPNLSFPKTIESSQTEKGCKVIESTLRGNFNLVDKTSNHVIYHSEQLKNTLVLFKERKESGSYAFYFTDIEATAINGKNIYTILSDYNEDDKNALLPYRSWALETYEYEHFLK